MANSGSEAQLIEQLHAVPLFHRTTKRQRKTLVKLGKVQKWKAGSTPIKEGTKGAAFFLILDGTVDITRGKENLNRLSVGDFVGEIALLQGVPRTADVNAVSDVTVFAMGRPALTAAIKTEPSIGIALLEAMARRVAM